MFFLPKKLLKLIVDSIQRSSLVQEKHNHFTDILRKEKLNFIKSGINMISSLKLFY